MPNEPAPEVSDLLRRIDALLAAGGNVLLFRQPELYQMTALVNRHTKAPVRFVVGVSLMIRASEDAYENLEGRRLEPSRDCSPRCPHLRLSYDRHDLRNG